MEPPHDPHLEQIGRYVPASARSLGAVTIPPRGKSLSPGRVKFSMAKAFKSFSASALLGFFSANLSKHLLMNNVK
jgi:hypothetical protein